MVSDGNTLERGFGGWKNVNVKIEPVYSGVKVVTLGGVMSI